MNESSIRKEVPVRTVSGIPMALFLIALIVGAFVCLITSVQRSRQGWLDQLTGELRVERMVDGQRGFFPNQASADAYDAAHPNNPGRPVESGSLLGKIVFITLIVIGISMLAGLFGVQPNQSVVLTLFGQYVGSVRQEGLRWVNPFYQKKRVSLRVRNFETTHLKVNDLDGNPIEIAAVVVWKIVDSAEALFQVDQHENYVNMQSETALRNLSKAYAYDSHEHGGMSLRGNTTEVAARLKDEIHDRLKIAGVEVLEARISHLAYSPEIASAMLQRQQASAIVAARTKIVEGAMGMVEMALDQLSKKGVVDLNEERKAALVCNLLVVLCGERSAHPVIKPRTLHH